VAKALEKELADQGRLVEGGFAAFAHICFNANTPDIQKVEMRKAFFAGALHLFQSVMSVLDEDREPTPNDLAVMAKLNDELDQFARSQKMFEAFFKRSH